MITIKRLNTPELIEKACALLHDVYIQQQDWHFSADNPAGNHIEKRGTKSLLVDSDTEKAIWFGAFDDDKLVGCIRLCGVDENNQFAFEDYPSSQPIRSYIPSDEKKHCYEISKVATEKNYVGRGIVKRLFLACFRFCQENQYHVFGFTHNGYLKSLLKKISFPLKKEYAFKYEPQDTSAVNLYFADYKKSEVNEILKNLEYLENDVSNNARSIFKALQTVEPILPTPFYWMNAQGVVLGINELGLQAMGTTHEIIGKKPYAFYKPEIAEHILKHNAEVMRKGEILAQEEWIEDITTKKRKCFSSVKAPLYDDEGTILGIVGTSIEITAQKEAESLKLENERQQIALQEKEKFAQLASQVVHDINSPLQALTTIIPRCDGVPEEDRITLIRATERIADITHNYLSNFRHQREKTGTAEVEPRQPLLVSYRLIELLSEKKAEYQNHPVTFNTIITHGTEFAFIQCQITEFQRALSNLINNAVDALEGKANGVVTIQLTVNGDAVVIEIADNGRGMPSVIKERMRRRQSFSSGKENGHGLGLQQVWDMLDYNEGEMDVQSTPCKGTTIKLTFTIVAAPDWIAKEIRLTPDRIIVILDDDESVHGAWNIRFTSLCTSYPTLRLYHFIQGQEILDFLTTLSQEEKNHVVFLSDYDLLHQDRNGLQIIEASGIKGATLVTSYYSNQKVRAEADRLGVRILPKLMAATIPVYMD
jgi:signal transduction histidine kinase